MTEKVLIIGPTSFGLMIDDIIKIQGHSMITMNTGIVTALEPYIHLPKEKPYNGAPVSARDIKRFERKRRK